MNVKLSQLLAKESPSVMGILNVTPDSFSDGGNYTLIDNALFQVEKMIEHGAEIIDIGGESTRPGATAVSVNDEIERVIPLLKAIKQRFNTITSIDTSKSQVMEQAISYGADIINDVRALTENNCLEVVANSEVHVCLMHMQGQPRTMQNNPQYDNLIIDIKDFFEERIKTCQYSGIGKERLVIDPGFGFGKNLQQNYELLAQLSSFDSLGLPVLVGLSRKSMIGQLLNRPVEQRLAGSITTAILAAQQGAKIIRVHDVQETCDAINILKMVNNPI